jgi:hypothetical protein
MKVKNFSIVGILFLIAAIIMNVNLAQSNSNESSSLTLANIQALSNNENPGSNYESSRCFTHVSSVYSLSYPFQEISRSHICDRTLKVYTYCYSGTVRIVNGEIPAGETLTYIFCTNTPAY